MSVNKYLGDCLMTINTVKGGYFYLLAAIAAVLLITAGWAQTASVE